MVVMLDCPENLLLLLCIHNSLTLYISSCRCRCHGWAINQTLIVIHFFYSSNEAASHHVQTKSLSTLKDDWEPKCRGRAWLAHQQSLILYTFPAL